MKKMKQLLLFAVCACVMAGTAACGSRDNVDNAADQTQGETNDPNMNDATEGTGNGVLDNAMDNVTDGVDDVTDDVTDSVDNAVDDMTDSNGKTEEKNNTDNSETEKK